MNPIYILVALTSCSHAVQVGGRLAVMLYAVHLSASPATVGLLSALFNLINIFTSVQVGRWIDKSGSRVPMFIGTMMIAVGTGLICIWPSLTALFVASVVIGSAHNLVFIAQQRLAGQYGNAEDRIKNFSVISLGQSAAGTLGPVAAGFAIEHAGYTETFLMFTLIGAAPLVLLIFGMLPYPPGAPPRARTAERKVPTRELLREPKLRAMYIVALLASSTWSIVTFLIPLYGTKIGLGASTIGIIIGAFSIATVVIRVVLPWMSRHISSWQMLIGSLIVSGVTMGLMPAFSSVLALTVLAVCIGFGLGLTGPISQALLHDLSPPDRIGELLGLRVTLLNASHAGVPIISGAVGAAIGVGPVFWVVAACLFAGGWLTRAQWHEPNTVVGNQH
ncbi:MAG: MFS transporter [Burkholderiales bacterium]